MAEQQRTAKSISQAEIKAGVFLTFCLALFIGMLFVLGKFGHAWRGHQDVRVVFSHVSALRREAPVRYNGMELGHVKSIRIIRADDCVLACLPAFARRDLPNLPLSDDERETLRALPEAGPGETVDQRTRALIQGRTMVLLVLDLLSENDTRRFRVDDEYRVSTSPMGDASVEIRTGCSQQTIGPGYDKYILGIGGDMYTDLGKSIAQVKDILASMAEMVGGDNDRQTVRNQLYSFESYTGRIDDAAVSIEAKLPETWNNVDARLTEVGKTFTDVEAKVKEIQPKVDEALDSARKSINETRESFAKSAGTLHDKVKSIRADSSKNLATWRTRAADYKESIPKQIHDGREWTLAFRPTVDKIDSVLTRADDQLDKGIASTRATLAGYLVTASNFEETTYRLKRWPASFAHKPDEEHARLYDLLWRRDLAGRQYAKLRGELTALSQGLTAADPSDKARLSRIADLIRESDAQLDAGPAPSGEKPRKGKK